MRRNSLILYGALFAFLVLDIFLFFYYRSLQKPKSKNLSQSPTATQVKKKVKFEFINQIAALRATANMDGIKKALIETKLFKNNQIYNTNTSSFYHPNKITLKLTPAENLRSLPLFHLFFVHGMPAFGYNTSSTPSIYTFNYYFNPQYLQAIDKEELNYSINSLIAKSFLHLSAIESKGRRLTNNEILQLSHKVSKLLKKYTFINVE